MNYGVVDRRLKRILRRGAVVVCVLAAGAATALAASSPNGKWSGTAKKGFNGDKVPPLPVVFKLEGSKVTLVSVGPATFECEPWNESGVTPVKVHLPKLKGFPTEKLFSGGEYDYAFVHRGRHWKHTTNPIVPQGPEYVSFDVYLNGAKLGQIGNAVLVSFGGDASGKPSATGSLGCGGNWADFFARPG
jgi:hypothetical protein